MTVEITATEVKPLDEIDIAGTTFVVMNVGTRVRGPLAQKYNLIDKETRSIFLALTVEPYMTLKVVRP